MHRSSANSGLMDKPVMPAFRNPVTVYGPARSTNVRGPRRAGPCVARNRRRCTKRLHLSAQTRVQIAGSDGQRGSEPFSDSTVEVVVLATGVADARMVEAIEVAVARSERKPSGRRRVW